MAEKISRKIEIKIHFEKRKGLFSKNYVPTEPQVLPEFSPFDTKNVYHSSSKRQPGDCWIEKSHGVQIKTHPVNWMAPGLVASPEEVCELKENGDSFTLTSGTPLDVLGELVGLRPSRKAVVTLHIDDNI